LIQIIGLLIAMAVLVVLAFKNWGMIPASILAAILIVIID